MLVKHPGLTFVAVAGMSVAVTIGAVIFSAIYTIVNERPSAQRRRSRRRHSKLRHATRRRRARTHLHDLAVWREALTTVGELGAYRTIARNLIADDNHAESTRVAEMTASGFRIVRVPPLMGRYFNDADERPVPHSSR